MEQLDAESNQGRFLLLFVTVIYLKLICGEENN